MDFRRGSANHDLAFGPDTDRAPDRHNNGVDNCRANNSGPEQLNVVCGVADPDGGGHARDNSWRH